MADGESFMKKYALIALYGLMFLFFLFKMFYYREELGYVPDEEAHISYLAYLEENSGKLLPDFEQMRLCGDGVSAGDGIYRYRVCDSACYLRHPPLYYALINLAGGVISEKTDGGRVVYADLNRLKTINIYLAGLTLLLVFYIGYTRLGTDSCLVHGLYIAAASSVPMLALCGSGVTNDNLANLGAAVCMIGILRHCEGKKGYLTCFLEAIGFFLSIMSKVSAGGFLAVLLLVILAAELLRNKNLSPLLNKAFFMVLPIYLLTGIYLIFLTMRGGNLLSGFAAELVREQGVSSGNAGRTFFGYAAYFIKQLGLTWTGLYNGRFYDYKQGLQGVVYLLLFIAPFFPAVALQAAGKEKRGASADRRTYKSFHIALAAGIIVTIVVQFLNGYQSFVSKGYTGGSPAGYYLCAVPFMAFALAEGGRLILKWKPGKENLILPYQITVHALGAAVILWLLYGDFICFLASHEAY